MPPAEPDLTNLPPYDGSAAESAQTTDSPAASQDDLLKPVFGPGGSAELETAGAAESDSETGTGTLAQSNLLKAPNGSAWPTAAAYVGGYSRLRTDGLSSVRVDNSANSSDVFVKLVAIDAEKTLPIRHVFIPAGREFTIGDVRRGRYDVRYLDLKDGSLARSESFELEEVEETDGVRYSNFTMTLYKVSNGNMQTYPLAASEF